MEPSRPTQQDPFATAGMVPTNPLATAGMVLGIIAAGISWIPLVGFIALIVALVGLPLAGAGLARAMRNGTGKGSAIAGIATNVLAILIWLGWLLIWGAAVAEADKEIIAPGPTTTEAGRAAKGVTVAPKLPSQLDAIPFGQPAKDGKFTFTTRSMECGVTVIGEGFTTAEAQGAFCLIKLTVTNHGKEPQDFWPGNQKLIDAKGREHAHASGAWLALDDSVLLEGINPGNSITTTLVFDLPRQTKVRALILHDSVFSGGVTVAAP